MFRNYLQSIATSIVKQVTVGRGCHPSSEVFDFFLDDKTSAPDVFSSCSFIPRTHSELLWLRDMTS